MKPNFLNAILCCLVVVLLGFYEFANASDRPFYFPKTASLAGIDAVITLEEDISLIIFTKNNHSILYNVPFNAVVYAHGVDENGLALFAVFSEDGSAVKIYRQNNNPLQIVDVVLELNNLKTVLYENGLLYTTQDDPVPTIHYIPHGSLVAKDINLSNLSDAEISTIIGTLTKILPVAVAKLYPPVAIRTSISGGFNIVYAENPNLNITIDNNGNIIAIHPVEYSPTVVVKGNFSYFIYNKGTVLLRRDVAEEFCSSHGNGGHLVDVVLNQNFYLLQENDGGNVRMWIRSWEGNNYENTPITWFNGAITVPADPYGEMYGFICQYPIPN